MANKIAKLKTAEETTPAEAPTQDAFAIAQITGIVSQRIVDAIVKSRDDLSKDAEDHRAKMDLDEWMLTAAEELVKAGEEKLIIDLLEEGFLAPLDFRLCVNIIESDDLLIHIVKKDDSKRIFNAALKFITDPDTIDAMLDEETPDEIKEMAEIIKAGLKAEPVIKELEKLEVVYGDLGPRDGNKFITGFSKSGKFFIGLSRRVTLREHADILASIKGETGEEFPKKLVGGGMVEVRYVDGECKVKFHGISLAFGEYDKKTLEKFRPEITKALKEMLGKEDITVEIKQSDFC
jgi:hypothetical protein